VIAVCFVSLILFLLSYSPQNVYGDNMYDTPQNSFLGVQIGRNSKSDLVEWWISVILIIIVICIVSQCGDMMFSWFKRKNNIKDFSNLLKEHGGILDRIDSLILVVMFFGLTSTIVAFVFTTIGSSGINWVFPTFQSIGT
jgi:CDP-diglyceride synthetase